MWVLCRQRCPSLFCCHHRHLHLDQGSGEAKKVLTPPAMRQAESRVPVQMGLPVALAIVEARPRIGVASFNSGF